MHQTKIEWVFNPDGSRPGWVWNPITGCLNGCPYCYARRLANGRLRQRYLANKNWDTRTPQGYDGYPNLDPFYPRFWFERLMEPIERLKPVGIFTVDMGELFGDWIPNEWQEHIFRIINECPQHRFYLLTKQPQNLPQFSPFPDNCWVGVTATNLPMFTNACILLGDIEASIKYISIEPFLSWGDYPADKLALTQWAKGLKLYGISWLIIGAQTKPLKLPDISWVTEIIEAGDKAGIPIFLKNNLAPLGKLIADFCGKKDWQLRQEMPK